MYIGYTQILGECAFLCAFCWLRYLAGIGSHDIYIYIDIDIDYICIDTNM